VNGLGLQGGAVTNILQCQIFVPNIFHVSLPQWTSRSVRTNLMQNVLSFSKGLSVYSRNTCRTLQPNHCTAELCQRSLYSREQNMQNPSSQTVVPQSCVSGQYTHVIGICRTSPANPFYCRVVSAVSILTWAGHAEPLQPIRLTADLCQRSVYSREQDMQNLSSQSVVPQSCVSGFTDRSQHTRSSVET
jgi:hypothetical protein